MTKFHNVPLEQTKKSKLQKSALYFAVGSVFAAIASITYLMMNVDTLGWENPISASLLASAFFFVFISFILTVIGTANIPSFKIVKESD